MKQIWWKTKHFNKSFYSQMFLIKLESNITKEQKKKNNNNNNKKIKNEQSEKQKTNQAATIQVYKVIKTEWIEFSFLFVNLLILLQMLISVLDMILPY